MDSRDRVQMTLLLKEKLNQFGDIPKTAKYFGVSPRTLSRWMDAHGIKQFTRYITADEKIVVKEESK